MDPPSSGGRARVSNLVSRQKTTQRTDKTQWSKKKNSLLRIADNSKPTKQKLLSGRVLLVREGEV